MVIRFIQRIEGRANTLPFLFSQHQRERVEKRFDPFLLHTFMENAK
jgi:hypothetical protein